MILTGALLIIIHSLYIDNTALGSATYNPSIVDDLQYILIKTGVRLVTGLRSLWQDGINFGLCMIKLLDFLNQEISRATFNLAAMLLQYLNAKYLQYLNAKKIISIQLAANS